MGSNYPSDGMDPEDQRLSSLRSSLISPHPAYMAQQSQGPQQWQHGHNSMSWDTVDPQYAYQNQYPYYQQQQQQQWMLGQYSQPGEQNYMAHQGYWSGYDPQSQQGFPRAGSGEIDMGNNHSDNKMGITENNGSMRQGSEPSSNNTPRRQQSAEHGESTQVRTPPAVIDHELQLKRAAAIASLQKRAASSTASGHEDTPSRGNSGTPPIKAKEGKPTGTQRPLFQPNDNKQKSEPLSLEPSTPVENSIESGTQRSSAADNIAPDNLKTPSKQPVRSQKQDDVETRKVSMPRKASSIDIDGLLAEGRAAAEASQKTKPVANGDGKGLDSAKLTTQPKEGSEKRSDTDVRPRRRSSLATAVSSDLPEPGEIRDEPEKQRVDSQSKRETPKSASSQKEPEPGTRKSQGYRPSNGLTKNPTTTKADTSFDDKTSKQGTNQVEKPEKRPFSKLEPRSTEKTKKPQSQHTRPDRPVYESPRESSNPKAFDRRAGDSKEHKRDGAAETCRGSNIKPIPRDIQKPDFKEAKLDSDNIFAHLDPLEVEELKEWLLATGYYDEDFRRKTMRRHKRLVALEKEKAELLKEEEEERGALTLARRNSFMTPDASSIPGTPSLSYLASMPPPKPLHKNDEGYCSLKKETSATNAVRNGSPTEDPHASRTPLKRRLSVSTGREDDLKPAEKLAKTGRDDDSPSSHDRNSESPDSRRPKSFKERREGSMRLTKEKPPVDGMNEERREALSYRRSSGSRSPDSRWGEKNSEDRFPRESKKFRRGWSDTFEYRGSEPFFGRGRGRGRFHRGSYRGSANFRPHRLDNKGRSDDLELHLGNVEYFVVKSWTYENVEVSQREGTWATQAKNVEKLSEAFEKCRHVILVFSVNNSKAFQGYARMESLPGAPGVRTPTWAEELVWEPSAPFKIRWITTNETKFRYVGHLKNSYNEDAPVLVGRDGQEIEPECGRNLCEIIKDEDPNKQANRPWTKPHMPMSYKTW